MKRDMKIGVMSDCFGLGPEGGVQKSAEVGAQGVSIYAVHGRISPEGMDAKARAEFKAFCKAAGVEIASLCGDMGGFAHADQNPARVERTKRVFDLARDLGTNIVTTHIGVVSDNPSDATYKTLLAACREVAQYAASVGCVLAVETGPEKATTLKKFLDDVGSKGIGVNLDPANLVMVVADDPVAAVGTLKDYIVSTHAKDGVQLRKTDAKAVYTGTATHEDGPSFKEVPLGEGGVRWDAYLDALAAIGFTGYLTIERECGEDRVGDITLAVNFLKKKLGR